MRKNMWRMAALSMALSTAFCVSVPAAETESAEDAIRKEFEQNAEPETEASEVQENAEAETEAAELQENAEPETEANAAETQADGAGEAQLSENLYDFQIQLDGEVYQFPMSYEEFLAYGWEISIYSDETANLEPNQFDLVYFSKGEVECMAFALNLGLNTMPVSECIIGGISIDNFDWDLSKGEVLLPGGIRRGVSTLEDVTAAYGSATDTYEGELYTSLTYEKDYYQSVELYIYKESGVLEDVEIRNFTEPEGFDAGEVNEEVPEEIAAYTAPEELGADLTSYTVEFDGGLYQLPCPVSELEANGWTIDTDDSAEYIPAKSSDWVAFSKDGLSFDILAYNSADYATIPSNCWVETLEAGGYGLEVSMKVPGAQIGTPEEELVQALEDAGVEYEMEEGSSYRYYQVGEYSWNAVSFYVYTDEESGSYPVNTVYKIEVGHEYE